MAAECPIKGLPSWVRPYPGDTATDAQRMGWWTEIGDAAAQANKPNLANYCRASALLIGAQVQQRENARLKMKLAEKVELSHDVVAQKVVDAVTLHTDARVKATFAALELRIGQVIASEDAALKRIGELSRRIDELEGMLAKAEALPR